MKFVKNFLTLGALVALFSQGAYGQMPGTFSPVGGVAGVSAVPDCTGGQWSYSGGNTIHVFVGSDNLVCSVGRSVNYLAVGGGGGGGGASYSGGGGAGGMLTGTTVVPAGSTSITVGAGGAAVASARGSSGSNSILSVPGGSSFLTIIPTQAPGMYGSGFGTSQFRTRILSSGYVGTAPATGTQIRVTIGGGTAGSNTLVAMYCGHAATASPSLDFDGSQVQIKFSGNAGVTVPVAGSPLVSDAVNYSFNKSKDLVCSTDYTGSQAIANTSAGSNFFGTYASGYGAANTTFGSTGTSGYLMGPIFQIEVLTNQTIVANALGGGGGGQYSSFIAGGTGASGGGAAYSGVTPAAGTAGQGNAGGINAPSGCGAGGGGAGAVGGNCATPNGGNGGAGLQSAITGTLRWYAAGGAGGPYTGVGGTGGSGIGGNGGNYSPATSCTPGAASTGSGGGGIASTGLCPGGSGVVVVAYPTGLAIPPPTCTPNTAGGGTFANVMALWHFDNNLIDSSGRGHTGTIGGTGGSLSSVQSKFGGYSYLGAAGSYVTTPGSTDFNMRTGDFTFEMWGYSTTVGANGFWGSNNTSNGGDWSTGYFSGNTITGYWGSTSYSPTWTYARAANTWTHYAFVRQSGTARMFVNGTEIAPSVTGQVGDINPSLADARAIGTYAISASYGWVGYIDEFRVSNMARYTGNFAPPTVPFCNN